VATINRTLDAVPRPITQAAPDTRLIRYRRLGVDVAEVYFEDELPEPLPPVDLVRFLAVLDPVTGGAWRRRHTLTIDLTRPEDVLLGRMGKSTRYKIRRAMSRDGLHAETFEAPPPDVRRTFADHYDEFAPSKGLRRLFRPRLELLARNGMLVLSRVTRGDDRALAWHAYAASSGRALLLYSASLFRDYADSADRNAIGRANRFLHWHDMLWFKAAGYSGYDLGGIDPDERDPVTRQINEFKQGFGGHAQPTHARTTALTPKGRVARALLRLGRVDF
jgi:hypothetical protein